MSCAWVLSSVLLAQVVAGMPSLAYASNEQDQPTSTEAAPTWAVALPNIGRDLVSMGSWYRLTVGTGSPGQWTMNTPPASLNYSAGSRNVRVPLLAEVDWGYFQDGRRYAVGLRLTSRLEALWVDQQANRSFDLQLGVPQAWIYARRYLTAGCSDPWYVEVAGGLPQSRVGLYAAQHVQVGTDYRFPARLQMVVGRGRVVAIEPRLRLEKIEALLVANGCLAGPLPQAVVRDTMLTWWSLRAELGYAQRLRATLALLRNAGLLLNEPNQATIYAFGRIFSDFALVQRLQGHDTRLTSQVGPTWSSGKNLGGLPTGPVGTILTLTHRHFSTVGFDRSLSLEPALAFAVRRADRVDNVGPTSNLFLDYARLSIRTPVTYHHYVYDALYNPRGVWTLRSQFGFGLAVPVIGQPARHATNSMLGFGGNYTWLRSRATAYAAGLDLDLGYAFGRFAYVVGVQVRVTFGQREILYIKPTEAIAGNIY
jgi:hypothetical protein